MQFTRTSMLQVDMMFLSGDDHPLGHIKHLPGEPMRKKPALQSAHSSPPKFEHRTGPFGVPFAQVQSDGGGGGIIIVVGVGVGTGVGVGGMTQLVLLVLPFPDVCFPGGQSTQLLARYVETGLNVSLSHNSHLSLTNLYPA